MNKKRFFKHVHKSVCYVVDDVFPMIIQCSGKSWIILKKKNRTKVPTYVQNLAELAEIYPIRSEVESILQYVCALLPMKINFICMLLCMLKTSAIDLYATSLQIFSSIWWKQAPEQTIHTLNWIMEISYRLRFAEREREKKRRTPNKRVRNN